MRTKDELNKLKIKALDNIVMLLNKGVFNIHQSSSCGGITMYGKYEGKMVIGGENDSEGDDNEITLEESTIEALASMEISPYDDDSED